MKANNLNRHSIALAVALTTIATGSQAATDYTIKFLSTDSIGLATPVTAAINDAGAVSGYAFNVDSNNAVMWDAEGNPRLIFPDQTTESLSFDINASNQVLIDPFYIWDNGVVTQLAGGGYGGKINDLTQMSSTGYLLINGGYHYRAFRSDYSSVENLGVLPGYTESVARNINNSGDVVGYSYTTSHSNSRATLWRNGNIIDLGAVSGQTYSAAHDINDNGRVVGASGGRLFTWENGVMTDLGTIAAGAIMNPRAINNSGDIVGLYSPSANVTPIIPFLWSNGIFTDLSSLFANSALVGCEFIDINNPGQIVVCSNVLTPTDPASDLTAAISAPSSAVSGTPFTYTSTIRNIGSLNATNVSFTSALPANAAYYSVTTSQGSCSGTSTINCNLNTLASGASAEVQITVTPSAAGSLYLSSTATGSEVENNTFNNTANRTVSVSAPTADMSASMTASASTIKRNANLTYTITVKNNGPVSTSGVTVTDTLPSSMKFVSASTTQGSCSGTTTVTCALGTMANGATATVKIVAQARSTGTFTNTAKVSASVTDNNAANNSSSVTTTVK